MGMDFTIPVIAYLDIKGLILGLLLWGIARFVINFCEKWKGQLRTGILDFFGFDVVDDEDRPTK